MPKRRKLAPWIFGDGPEPVSVELTVDQKQCIAARVGLVLSAQPANPLSVGHVRLAKICAIFPQLSELTCSL
jgi:hypothetical protein